MTEQVTPSLRAPVQIDTAIFAGDPHGVLAGLRKDHAAVQTAPRQYLVLRGEDVVSLLGNPSILQCPGPDYVEMNRVPEGVTARLLRDFFLLSNGEVHRQKRGMFARSFAHRLMQQSRPIVRDVANRIVADLPRGETFDFVEHMASPVPAHMISAILGLPRADTRYFTRCVYEISRAVDPVYPHHLHDRIENATGELFDYVDDQLKARLTRPRDDLLSMLVSNWQEEPKLSFESLILQVLGMIVAASDTTRSGFAMLVALLLESGEWSEVRADPALIPGAVNEALRYEPAVGSIPRFTSVPVTIRDAVLPAGSILRLSTMSAMRDPAIYRDPTRFDIRRGDHPKLHMVFGRGPHRCIGEMLARIEMEEGLAALLDAAPTLRLEKMPELIGYGGLRRVTPMPTTII
ncbi:MAG: cytochrome P450 [Heliomarina sp.]|uniref:cytochrome P450 n=1 Tax=Heliomarina sp. TaxID=2917556 RepID=UPI00405A4B79